MSEITFVTALLDIKREDLKSKNFQRSFQRYLDTLSNLLSHLKDKNLVIYVEKEHEETIRRLKPNNLIVKYITCDQIRRTEYYDKIQKIRNDEQWRNQVGWLRESTQACLELYNPLIFQKMHFLDEVSAENPFGTKYFFWVDAGIANAQCHPGYFSKPWFETRLISVIEKFLFLCFPYKNYKEIHGFEKEGLFSFSGTTEVDRVARATFFGGKREEIRILTSEYSKLAHSTLDAGYMGTEESLFTILTYTHNNIIQTEMIEPNGLVYSFFENLQKQTFLDINEIGKTDLYVITYNSPKQFETLIESMLNASPEMFKCSDKYVLNNSTESRVQEQYSELFKKYQFTEFKKDNIGICGGRQFIAEHFQTTNNQFMLFFEDDMQLNGADVEPFVCKNGFNKYHNNLYSTALQIILKEKLDFLKLSFTEFYGDNSTQWAWYNVPQNKREEYWPSYCKLPERGHDPNSPKTVFNTIKSLDGLPYATGEVYYCNWPQIVSKRGNKKMFLETKWAHPYEQTWMSYIFQKTKQKLIKSGVLLLTPINHDRFEHYSASERKES